MPPLESSSSTTRADAAERHGILAEPSELDADAVGRVVEGLLPHHFPNSVEQGRAELQSEPTAYHDQLGIEQVGEVGGGHSVAVRRFLQDAGSGSARLRRLEEAVGPPLLVRVAGRGGLRVRLSPGGEQRLCPDVGLETPGASAAAAPSSRNDAVVAPLPGAGRGAPVESSIGEDGRPDTSAPEGDHGVMRAAASTEPHLHLSQRFGTVLNKDRSANALSHQALEGNVVPTDDRSVDPVRRQPDARRSLAQRHPLRAGDGPRR